MNLFACTRSEPNLFDRYIGSTTCAAAVFGLFCFCFPGFVMLCCPIDERDVYKVDENVSVAGNIPFEMCVCVRFTLTTFFYFTNPTALHC